MLGTASRWTSEEDIALDREVDTIARALSEHGPTDRVRLAELVGGRYWGPGRFRAALREAVHEGRAQPLTGNRYGPADPGGRS